MSAAAYQRGSLTQRRILNEEFAATREERRMLTAKGNRLDQMQERIDALGAEATSLQSELQAAQRRNAVLLFALSAAIQRIERLEKFERACTAYRDVALNFYRKWMKVSAYFRAAEPNESRWPSVKEDARVHEPKAFEPPYPIELAQVEQTLLGGQ